MGVNRACSYPPDIAEPGINPLLVYPEAEVFVIVDNRILITKVPV